MNLQRIFRHLLASPMGTRRQFPASTLRAIEATVRDSEARHSGEIRFALETALPLGALLRGQSARERAIEVFAQLRVWDTERNNGVLIYLLLADHDVEIVADRGVHAKVGAAGWEAVCRKMETDFRAGRFEAGALAGIKAIGELLQKHFPQVTGDRDELPNPAAVL